MTRSAWRDHDWRLLPDGAESPAMHVALDDVLLDEVAAGRRPPTFRFWEWTQRAVVLGRFQSVRNEIDPAGAERNSVQLVRRISGGGAMFVEPGNTITFSVYAPASLVAGLSIVDSYAYLDAWLVEALSDLGVAARYEPINDVTSEAGKIGGAAQIRRGDAVLHHVTMAYRMDPTVMTQVLRIGKEKLSDKGVRSADKRVAPLGDQLDMPREAIVDRLRDAFRARTGGRDDDLSDAERSEARRRAHGVFASEGWTHRVP